MSKYFDKLVKMDEGLTNELKDRGLYKEGDDAETIPVPADSLTDDQKKEILVNKGIDQKLVNAMSPEEMDGALKVSDDEQAATESVDADISTMDWDGPAIIKKESPDGDSFYVKDSEWSSDIQDAYEFPGKEDAADKIGQLGGKYMFVWPATMKKEGMDESINEAEGEVYLRMDDDDLDIHGYVQWEDDKVNFIDNEQDADVFASKADAESAILDICDMFNYDPETFSTQEVDSQVSDNGENWVSIDSSNPSATVIP